MIASTPDVTGEHVLPAPNVADRESWAPPTAGRPDGSRFHREIWWMAASALFVVIVAVAALYYLTSSVTVDLSVDGQTQQIDTRANSVADLLADQEIIVTEADMVDPPLDAELAGGETIVVQFARPLTVLVDGSETLHTTTTLTVGDALRSIDAPIDGAAVSMPLTEALPLAGATVEIITPKAVSLTVGGAPLNVTSTARTVGEVLQAEGIILSETDTVAPAAEALVTEAMAITVTRIRVENEVRTEPIAHDTTEQDDPDATVGTRNVVTEGVDGSQDVTYSVTYTDDQITSEEVLSTTVTAEPVTEVVEVGTKPAPVQNASAAAADLNWAALAECESSGNPKAVNPAGYYGLYQFSLPTWKSVGGVGNPADASPAEQTSRAQILYDRSGPGQWPHCGPNLFK